MTNEEYKKLVNKYIPKENKKKKYLISFITGGLMGVIAEILTILYTNVFNLSHNESTSFMMITIIIITCILTGLGVFDELIKKAGAGLFIPITGFAHATASSTLDYKKEGLVFGIGSNLFKLSGSVIVYATVSSFVFAIIRYIVFGG